MGIVYDIFFRIARLLWEMLSKKQIKLSKIKEKILFSIYFFENKYYNDGERYVSK